jgi:uncharacterized protein involved in type VI secretion and phage assembly
MAELNAVEATISIDGKKIHFTYMRLYQKYNTHHECEIHIDHEEFGELWMDDPTVMIKYIGKDINITMKHKISGEENLFAGIVTNVSFSGYHGEQNSIIITGASPTIKLSGKPTMDSFMDLPLQQVVQEAVSNSGNGCPVTVKPKFGSKLGYVCQYDENCFDFLNRLSWEFGEWFYYDGQTCYFGMKEGKGTRLEYDKEMTYFDLSANLIPEKFNRYHYLWNDDKEIDKEEMSEVPGVRGYLKVSETRSKSVYTAETKLPLIPNVNTKKDLDDLVKAEKSRTVGEMLIMRGKTQTCKVKIGGTVNINLPAKMKVAVKSVDTFLVTQVTHVIDQEGHYSNSFEAVLSGIEAIPMAEPHLPVAGPQVATVKSNADSKGRVKVQTQWQKSKNKTTNWIHVQTPDAGKSGKVASNRGLVTIPEEGDTIMLNFEYGNPSRPYVSGSIFTSKTGTGGGAGNKNKSLTTRSGSTVTLDDDTGSVLIKDQIGSQMMFDGAKSISINCEKLITIQCGPASIVLDGENNKITLSAQDISIEGGLTVNIQSGETVDVTAGTNFTASATENASMNAMAEATVSGTAKAVVTAMGEVALDGAIVKLN